VLSDLVDQVLAEPLYDTLRTKQQLGYTVSSGTRMTHGVTGFCVVVVSAAYDADTVEACIEAFMQDFSSITLQVRPLCACCACLHTWLPQPAQRHAHRAPAPAGACLCVVAVRCRAWWTTT
jgi:hypothetical protein